ncbi:hypothetical protein KR222_009002, partial [Zaprionus bogoriensis]
HTQTETQGLKMTECVNENDNLEKLEGLPRDLSTFWCQGAIRPPCTLNARDALHNPFVCKMSAYPIKERQVLGIHGLLPAGVMTIEQQIEMNHQYLMTVSSHLAKFCFLTSLELQNTTLFYRLLMHDPEYYMAVFHSSTTDFLIRNFSLFYRRTTNMFITIKDRGHIYDVLVNWPQRRFVHCLAVTTGESVLSLGDNGVHGTPVVLHRRYSNVVHGGVDPESCLPITLDVGTNNEELLRDPSYLGLRQKRVSDREFDEFFEEFTLAVLRLFGPQTIISTKDFGVRNALRQCEIYRTRQCYFDVDLQCMGACGLAGVIAAGKITQLTFKDNRILFYGQSVLNIGMARLCLAYLKRMGLNDAEAKDRIWFCDDKGLIVHDRCGLPVPGALAEFRRRHEPVATLVDAIDSIRPNVLVSRGVEPRVFTREVLRAMERSAQHPIIFALSRPLERAECTAEEAFVNTKGRCIFVSGVELPKLKYANKWYKPGCCNAYYLNAGLTQGILLSGMVTVPDETFLVVADRLASMVWPTDLAVRDVYPPIRRLRCINLHIADAIFSFAYRRGLATLWPEPKNSLLYITSRLFEGEYKGAVPQTYCLTDRMIGTTESLAYYKQGI